MKRYVAGRVLQSLVLLWCVTVVTFGLMQLAPGGPAVLADPNLSQEQVQSARASLGLDDPLPVQYVHWLGRVVQGDLGTSFDRGVAVTDVIEQRLPNTLLLAGSALLLAVVLGVAAGVVAAWKRNTWIDGAVSTLAVTTISVPPFWLGIVAILIFAVELGWLPASGMYSRDGGGLMDLLQHLVLPAFVTGAFMVAVVMRFTRAAMLDVLQQTYVANARARGLPEWRVLFHALRNAAVPLITVIALGVPALVGGTAIVEAIFGWPGLGQLAIESAANSDYPLIMGITLVMSLVVIVVNLSADLSYTIVDPRVRLGDRA